MPCLSYSSCISYNYLHLIVLRISYSLITLNLNTDYIIVDTLWQYATKGFHSVTDTEVISNLCGGDINRNKSELIAFNNSLAKNQRLISS